MAQSDTVLKAILETVEKYGLSIEYRMAFDTPKDANKLPEDLKLALMVLMKHKMRISIVLAEK